MSPTETVRALDDWSEDEVAKALASRFGLKNPVSTEFLKVCFDNTKLFDKKQTDYGPSNIRGFGTFGVLVRMNDKFERLKTLFTKRRRKPQNESILDSFRDASIYGTIAILLETNKWP